ncbi:MAG: hypothetical protein JO163_19175 [Methylobacteriaceae bacterium]|nr:hypothetical protein [Methylobacteriaceae bacterium]
MHDRFVARQFEFDWDANRLVAAIAEKSDVPLLTHWGHLQAYVRDIGRPGADSKGENPCSNIDLKQGPILRRHRDFSAA